jgi:flagellar basal-body rod modification protein FlgD
MNQITPTNASIGTQTKTEPPQQSLGQADFLELMVAQLQNQDPSEPMDNNQFLSQMAQFSMVNGIDSLNTGFSNMSSSILGDQGLQAAGLLDRQALVETSLASFDGKKPITGTIEAPPNSSDIKVTVKDNSGSVVRVFAAQIGPSGQPTIEWDGRDQQGKSMAAGNYNMTATANVAGNQQGLPLAVSNTITSVSIDSTSRQIKLNLSNGNTVALSDVKEYR